MPKGMRNPDERGENLDDADRPSRRKKGGPRHVEETGVIQLRVALEGIVPEIFRRLLVPAEVRLDELSHILIEAMGWEGVHLHRFLQGAASYSDVEFELEEAEDESKYSLGELLAKEGDNFEYEYDFGDNWVHKLTVEKLCPSEDGVHYPVCTDGTGACPPEDCGGVAGFAEMVQALADPKHKRHAELRDWLGRPFDPAAFETKEANDRLRRLA